MAVAFGALLPWYYRHRRAMPWRDKPTPYRVWISEIMLQQTRVEAVIPYFNRFLQHFPDVQTLAAAGQEAVLKLWEGLGYYSRARNLHKAAIRVVDEYGGALPQASSELQTLPGFGPYTAAAVASIAFGEPVPVVDGNVLRVAARVWALDEDIAGTRVRKDVAQRLQPFIIASGDPSAFNQGMMELGATLCLPQKPQCPACPLASACVAYNTGRTGDYPVKAKAGGTPHYDVFVAVIQKKGKWLLQQRPDDGMLGGMWEWPGGRLVAASDPAAALAVRVHQQTGIRIDLEKRLTTVDHAYSHFRISVHPYTAAVSGGRRRAAGVSAVRWVGPRQVQALPLGKAARQVLASLRNG